ncbi:hypothetical protein BN381_630001 [Candidatus Microthrix parvicella RN1]|uniref:Uncharacterized protein n=1 Tax=Candidatus Neomicrothrix parvicella RN1 TaxID=1229780 RepID=R4Z2T6_9ACTN|nr:hypothetical protein BN381_630001 [Candidatus Microthrix parvicella RN1]
MCASLRYAFPAGRSARGSRPLAAVRRRPRPLSAGLGRTPGCPPGPVAAPRLPAVGRARVALAYTALVAGVDAAHATTLPS